MESDAELELISTERLVREIARRHDRMVCALYRDGVGDGEYPYTMHMELGNPPDWRYGRRMCRELASVMWSASMGGG